MIELVTEQACTLCKHYRGNTRCLAYPDGIPDKIVEGFTWTAWDKETAETAPVADGLDHRLPIEGDNGFQWRASGDWFDHYIRVAWWGEDKSKWPVSGE